MDMVGSLGAQNHLRLHVLHISIIVNVIITIKKSSEAEVTTTATTAAATTTTTLIVIIIIIDLAFSKCFVEMAKRPS